MMGFAGIDRVVVCARTHTHTRARSYFEPSYVAGGDAALVALFYARPQQAGTAPSNWGGEVADATVRQVCS